MLEIQQFMPPWFAGGAWKWIFISIYSCLA